MEENYKQVYLSDSGGGNVRFFMESLKPVNGLFFDEETGTLLISEKFAGSAFYLNATSALDEYGNLSIINRSTNKGNSLWTVKDINNRKGDVLNGNVKALRTKNINNVIIKGINNKWFYILDGILWCVGSKTRWIQSKMITEHKSAIALVLLDKTRKDIVIDMSRAIEAGIEKGFDLDNAEMGRCLLSGSSPENIKFIFRERSIMNSGSLEDIKTLKNMILENRASSEKTNSLDYSVFCIINEIERSGIRIKNLFGIGNNRKNWPRVFDSRKNDLGNAENIFIGTYIDETGKITGIGK